MISYIQGKILTKIEEDRYDIIEVLTNQGVGYEVFVPKQSVEDGLDSSIVLFTSQIFREDSQTLYGFKSRDEKKFFNLLITVSGIGPKSAITVMSKFTIAQTSSLIVSEDFKTLATVPGLGAKSAQKIIVELKDRIGWVEGSDVKEIDDTSTVVLSDLKQALTSLGFDNKQVKESIAEAKLRLEKQKYSVEELLKFALSGK